MEESKGPHSEIKDNLVKWRFNKKDPKSKEMTFIQVEEPVVRLQRTSVQEYVDRMAQTQLGHLGIDSDFEEDNMPL